RRSLCRHSSLTLITSISSAFLFSSSFLCPRDHQHLHSFPTRRSSDLLQETLNYQTNDLILFVADKASVVHAALGNLRKAAWTTLDRKSTRLNSSHVSISYAVFCLKKKKVSKIQILRDSERKRMSIMSI